MAIEEPSEAARALVESLFTNGFGQKAERLVLVNNNFRHWTGWSRGPVIDKVQEYARAVRREALEEAARIAETEYRRDPDGIDKGYDAEAVRTRVTRRIAARLRALAQQVAKPVPEAAKGREL